VLRQTIVGISGRREHLIAFGRACCNPKATSGLQRRTEGELFAPIFSRNMESIHLECRWSNRRSLLAAAEMASGRGLIDLRLGSERALRKGGLKATGDQSRNPQLRLLRSMRTASCVAVGPFDCNCLRARMKSSASRAAVMTPAALYNAATKYDDRSGRKLCKFSSSSANSDRAVPIMSGRGQASKNIHVNTK
jgi:hypothetical protein